MGSKNFTPPEMADPPPPPEKNLPPMYASGYNLSCRIREQKEIGSPTSSYQKTSIHSLNLTVSQECVSNYVLQCEALYEPLRV
jgi:hypothetical protein